MADVRAERVADNILKGCISRSESTLVIITDHETQLEATLMVFSLRQKMMKPNVSVILEKLQDFLRLQYTGIVMKVSKCQFLETEARTWKRQHHSRCPVTNGRIASSNSNLLRRVYHHIPVEPSDIGKSLPPGHHSNSTLMVFSLRQKMMKPNVSVILEKLQDFLRLQYTGIVMKVSKCQFLETEARTWKRQHHSRCPVTNGRIASSNSNLLRRVYRHIPVEPSDIGKSLPPGHHSVSTLMVFSLRQKMMKPNVSVILEKLQDFLRLQDTGIVMKVSKCQFLETEARTWKRQHHSRCPVTNGRIASSNSNLLRRYSNDTGNGHGVKRHSNFP
ncbi:hypothetical protein TNCV_4516731 [Trichonephila clavipes]|nr:hypothetical protein TNCV_4516731 [Trichonephila clavipes]